jgi:hypothetical protein
MGLDEDLLTMSMPMFLVRARTASRHTGDAEIARADAVGFRTALLESVVG